jgi:hypothetical protein
MESNLWSELKAATKGLHYVSESDRPVKPFTWKEDTVAADTIDAEAVVRSMAKVDAVVPLKTQTVERFFAPMLNEYPDQPEEEKATAQRFRDLQTLLTRSLADVKVIRIEQGPDIPVYVIGKTPAGEWAGVHTVLVET